jgi:predicted nucleic acid-binding protein
LLIAALAREYTALTTVALVLEYEAVMARLEHLKASRLTAAEMSSLLDSFVSVAEPVRLSFFWRPVLRDPDDEMVLEAAINGGADAIVTLNQRDFTPEAGRFGIAVWAPGEAFERLKRL